MLSPEIMQMMENGLGSTHCRRKVTLNIVGGTIEEEFGAMYLLYEKKKNIMKDETDRTMQEVMERESGRNVREEMRSLMLMNQQERVNIYCALLAFERC